MLVGVGEEGGLVVVGRRRLENGSLEADVR